jgi:molybdopterin molybdotransferase
MPGEALKLGQIYNSNRFTLTGLLEGLGCEVRDFGIVPDNFDATVSVLDQAALQSDLIITSGGVSVGEEDHVKAAVEKVGRIDMWRIAIKPGKPLAYGLVGETPFIGLPGNPVSSFVTFCLFVRPFIRRSQGIAQVLPKSFNVRAEFDWPKPGKRREYARARLDVAPDGTPTASLFPNQSSGVLTSMAWADGLVDIPVDTTIARGQAVRFIPFSELVG